MSYLSDVILRLNNLSAEHSQRIAFQNQPWICCSGAHEGQTFYFQGDGKLLIIKDGGETKIASWQHLKNMNAILITDEGIHLTLKRQFWDRAIMAFLGGDEPFYFVNSSKLEEASMTARAFLESHVKELLRDADPDVGGGDPDVGGDDSETSLIELKKAFWEFVFVVLTFSILVFLVAILGGFS